MTRISAIYRNLVPDLSLVPAPGIGWTAANPAVGRVYFTLNGAVLQGEQQDVPAGLFPVIHIHRKVRSPRFGQLQRFNRSL